MSKFTIHRPIVIDWETYYDADCSVKSDRKRGWVGGNYKYVTHPRFEAYMVSYLDPVTGERGVLDDQSKFHAFVASLEGRTVIAHNAGFDAAVAWSVNKDFKPLNTFDTADMASYLQSGRSLAVATPVLLGRPLIKDMRDFMKGKRYGELDAATQKAMRDYALSDAIAEAELFTKYKDQWPDLEKWASNFTREQNWAGVHIDSDYLQDQVDKVLKIRSDAIAKIPWVEDSDDKPQSAKQLGLWCREVGIEPPTSLAEDSEECQAWEAKYGDQYPVVAAIRDYRKSNTYYKKLTLIEGLLRPDGTIPLDTMYAAAPHTLRFSARGFNFQSLPRDSTYCDLRGCLVPDPGEAFVPADLSGIEARCLPWLAGDAELLGKLAVLDKEAVLNKRSGGGDLYYPYAQRMFNYSGSPAEFKKDKALRNTTKICVLQLGYSSGKAKFNWFVGNNLAPEMLDQVRVAGETDRQLTDRLVDLFRGLNPKIKSLWYDLDNGLRASCHAGMDFKIQSPNGRFINYYNLMVRESVQADGRSRAEVVGSVCRGIDESKKLYGGKLTENICQEMARHVLVESLYNLTAAGFKIKFSVHDENVISMPVKDATADTRWEIERIMSLTPSWAPGLPLAAETAQMDRYAK